MRTGIMKQYDEEEAENEEYHRVLQTELSFRASKIKELSYEIEKLIKEDERKEKEQK